MGHPKKNGELKTFKDYALHYASNDLKVLPVWGIGKSGLCSCSKGPDCSSPGKHPIYKGGYKKGTTDFKTIENWWRKHPNANVAIATGLSNLFVLDIDKKSGGYESLAQLVGEHGELPQTLTVATGGGGRHYYFNKPEQGAKSSANILPGIDVRADGGLIVAPPSLHISGERYRWES